MYDKMASSAVTYLLIPSMPNKTDSSVAIPEAVKKGRIKR